MRLKNTYYLILVLSILAALILGLNIGKRMQQTKSNPDQTQNTIQEESPTSAPITLDTTNSTSSLSGINNAGSESGFLKNAAPSGGTAKGTLYTSKSCGVSFSYPDTVMVEESTTDAKGAVFTNKSNPTDMVVLTCQKDIPKPPLPSQNIEDRLIGTTPAKLYHDTSQKDGTRVDALLFTHPKTKLDVFIGGYGTTFNTLIQSLKIL
ncbi:TPA: hypothetical protein DIS60_01200 [Patescibacteria group bacterium]|nr:hypothetical protein [Patescibacteria group bacterium]